MKRKQHSKEFKAKVALEAFNGQKRSNEIAKAILRRLGRVEYEPTWRAMRTFTDRRGPATADEVWLLEHPPVFTLGQAGRWEHVLAPGDVPIVHTDRGGQVTYHGPGQLVAYVLLDLNRRRIGPRRLVEMLEQSVIALAAQAGIEAAGKKGAPGVYVAGRKLAALGLRVRRGCCYHGLALNVRMDLEPFDRIDPCGYPDLGVTQLTDLGVSWTMAEVEQRLARQLLGRIEAGTGERQRCTIITKSSMACGSPF